MLVVVRRVLRHPPRDMLKFPRMFVVYAHRPGSTSVQHVGYMTGPTVMRIFDQFASSGPSRWVVDGNGGKTDIEN